MKFSQFAILAIAGGALLAACAPPAPPVKPEPPKPDRDPAAAVVAIRAAGTQLESAVEVKPLRDPAVDGLLKQAHDLEAHAQYAPALDAVHKAEKIAGPAPDILQFDAELLVEQRQWQQAGEVAKHSWDVGAKVGSICARNQQTLFEVASALGDAAGAAQAKVQVAACKQAAPNRF
jgi:hypothetical protein